MCLRIENDCGETSGARIAIHNYLFQGGRPADLIEIPEIFVENPQNHQQKKVQRFFSNFLILNI